MKEYLVPPVSPIPPSISFQNQQGSTEEKNATLDPRILACRLLDIGGGSQTVEKMPPPLVLTPTAFYHAPVNHDDEKEYDNDDGNATTYIPSDILPFD